MWKPNRTKNIPLPSTSTAAPPGSSSNNSLKSVFSRLSGSRSGSTAEKVTRADSRCQDESDSSSKLKAGVDGVAGRTGGEERQGSVRTEENERTVLVHFMLGNTYPYTPITWASELDLIRQTGIDAIVLNLGKEDWQVHQARSALSVLEGMSQGESGQEEKEGLKVVLSLDMNVLPSSTVEDMWRLVSIVMEVMQSDRYLRTRCSGTSPCSIASSTGGIEKSETADNQTRGKQVLSTFGGHDCSFGGKGWAGFLDALKEKGCNVFFIPSFFLPPNEVLGMPVVDGAFNWNAAWPMGDYPTSMVEDLPFIRHEKPYMAAVSPWFFTHYGTVGEWAWNKNWIYRSDDHLYASRWSNIVRPEFDPEFVQIISWNDFGESHYIGPIVGAEPGSQDWTRSMPHEGWRKMTEWFVRRYKRVPLELETETRVYLTYRLQSKDCVAEEDKTGRPDRADFAQDVISIMISMPPHAQCESKMVLTVDAGHMNTHDILLGLKDGLAMALVPFIPGPVAFQLRLDGKVILQGQGPLISNEVGTGIYNFNAWTGTWGTED